MLPLSMLITLDLPRRAATIRDIRDKRCRHAERRRYERFRAR